MDGRVFADRRDAGRSLAAALSLLHLEDPLVLGIARGGVIVAREVAAALQADLGVAVARKLGAPSNPELGIGAVSADGTVVLDEEVARATGAGEAYIRTETEREVAEARRRIAAFDGKFPGNPAGRNVILVDDGIATGVTAKAALRALRGAGAAAVVLAVPCAPPQTVDELRQDADKVVALVIDRDFIATGQYYRDFRPVSDDEVREALETAVRRRERISP
jgi:predicted phosphoribosyltransferase